MKRLWNRDRQTGGSNQRGDTLVEVAIAMAVLGLVLAATMTIINRSLLSVMNAVERTGARGEVNSQVEMLRYVFDTQSGINKAVANQIVDSTGTADISDNGCSAGAGSFYLTTQSISEDNMTPIQYHAYTPNDMVANTVYAAPHAVDDGGIWIEGSKHEGSDGIPGYVDFYVRACWSPYASNEVGQGRLESIVRVYLSEEDG